ncbi:MAG: photosystem II protein Y [Prochloraceae cyanobacterium]|nr:photosystem II protein Y [Prochloraceae cyanobacterium]
MDWRIVFVLGPIALALSWALFNIAGAAISQVQNFLGSKEG